MMNATLPDPTLSPVDRVARLMSDEALRHVNQAIEADLLAFVESYMRPTAAHAGLLEMLNATGRELLRRAAITAVCGG